MGKFKDWLSLQEGIVKTAHGQVFTGPSINMTTFKTLVGKYYGAKFFYWNKKWHMFRGDTLHENIYRDLSGHKLDYFYKREDEETYKSLLPVSVEKDYAARGKDVFRIYGGGGPVGRNEAREYVRIFMKKFSDVIFSPYDEVKKD